MIKDFFRRNGIFLIIIALLLSLLSFQCNRNSSLVNDKIELNRTINNTEADNAKLKTYVVNDSIHRGEIQGHELTEKELKKQYSDLLGSFEILKKEKVKTVIKTEFILKDSIVMPTNVLEINGQSFFVFSDSTFYSEGNWRKVSGKLPYDIYLISKTDTIKLDSAIYSKAVPGNVNLNIEQSMTLSTGLFKDKKTGKIMIKVDTGYPNMSFVDIKGASIMEDPNSYKLTKEFRKTFGFGFNIGYGLNVNKSGIVSMGPQVSIGLNVTPKWLQFGK
jgi:hypothetical protein